LLTVNGMDARNEPAPMIDTTRPYGRVYGTLGVAFTQDDAWYDLQGRLVHSPSAEPLYAASPPAADVAATAHQTAPVEPPAKNQQISPGAERMRRSRQRRRNGLRCIPFEVRYSEVDGLVTLGLLDPVTRNDEHAIGRALGKLLDTVPPERWPVAPRR
jgi:hypothetical protein